MIYGFGENELDDACFELRRAGQRIDLQPKALALLLFLVRNHDRAVAKSEILDAVWPDTLVTDNSLARAVRLARVAIGDGGARPTSIVTVPRHGYRFAAPVRAVSATPTQDAAARYVGRAQLLGRLCDVLDGALRGSGRVLFLVGEAGIGKTRTTEVLAERARQSGALVAAAWGMEGMVPVYPIWSRVLRELLNAMPELLRDLPRSLRADLAPLLPDRLQPRAPVGATSTDSVRVRLFEAAARLLSLAASRRPLVLVLDDFHTADAESLWLLEFVGQAISSLPVAIVATFREEDAGRTPQQARALERLLRLGSLQRWPLVGLPGPEVREFVRLRVGRDPAPALIEALEHKTGGNPLLLGESLRSLKALGLLAAARDAKEWQELLPAGIQHLLRPKLLQLSPPALEVLACAAAIGMEFDRSLLARCVPDQSHIEPSLREARDAGLMRAGASATRLRFPHPLVREALYVEMVPPGEARRALHARVFAALEEVATGAPESLAVRAHHACEAAPLVGSVRAAALARAVGEEAVRLYDFERAAEWYGRALAALELAPDSDRALVAELLLALGDAQVRAVGLERARASYRVAAEHARSIGRGDLLARAALGLAQEPGAAGYGDPELVEALEEAECAVPPVDRALRIRVQSRLGAELRHIDRVRGMAHVEAAIADARRLGNPSVLARTLEDALYVRFNPEDPAASIALNGDIVRAARAAGDLELVLLAKRSSVAGHLELGDIAAVDREIRACERTAAVLRTPHARWQHTGLRAMRALVEGDLEAAERDVGMAIQFGERLDGNNVLLQLSLQLAYLRLEQGRVAEIEPGAREQVRLFPDSSAWRAGLARILVATGRSAEAREELGRLARSGFVDVARDRGWLMTLALASEVAYATGDVRASDRLEQLLRPCAHLCVVGGTGLVYYGPVSHHLGLLALARSRWDVAIGHFDAALEIEERCRARVWCARTQLASARAYLGRGESGRARAASLVAEASATARAHGLADISADASQLTSRIWPRDSKRRGQRGSAAES